MVDLDTNNALQFIARSWLHGTSHTDESNCKYMDVATERDLLSFQYLYPYTADAKLRDDHTWWSIYAKPPENLFTRCQR